MADCFIRDDCSIRVYQSVGHTRVVRLYNRTGRSGYSGPVSISTCLCKTFCMYVAGYHLYRTVIVEKIIR